MIHDFLYSSNVPDVVAVSRANVLINACFPF